MTLGHLRRIGAAAALLLATTVAFVAFPSAASAAPCEINGEYAGSIVITVDPPGPVSPGQQITISGTGFPPNCEVQIIVNGVVVGTVTTGPDGSFSFGYTLGANISGEVVIGVAAGDFVRSVTLPVAGSGDPGTTPTAGSGSLPRTGSDATLYAGIGVGLLAAGGLVLLATRKRQHAGA